METVFPNATGDRRDPRPGQPSGPEPPTFGIYDEGDGLLSLYARPYVPLHLVEVLDVLDLADELIDVTPAWGTSTARPVILADLARREAPLELIHEPDGDELDRPGLLPTVMAAPHALLPEGSSRRFAFALHDRDHAAFYSRDRDVLAQVLTHWLRATLDEHVPGGESPPILDRALESVMEAMPPQAWRRLDLEVRGRIWSLDLSALVTERLGESTVVDEQRWVGGPGRAWRAGWSW